MEFTSFIVFCCFVVFSVLIIIVVSVFGVREKTYEEVILEHRNKDVGNGLVLKSGKSSKEKKKKNKKPKDGKEKAVASEETAKVPVTKIKRKLPASVLPLAEVKPLSVNKPVVLQTKSVKSASNKTSENEVKPTQPKKMKKEVIETDKEKGKNKKNNKVEAKPIKAEIKPLKAENKTIKVESKTVKVQPIQAIEETKAIKPEAKKLKTEPKPAKKEPKTAVGNPKPAKIEPKQKDVNAKVEAKNVKNENKSESNLKKTENRDVSNKNTNELPKRSISAPKIEDNSPLPISPSKKPKKLKYDMSSGDNGMNGIHLATVLRNAILTDAELQTLIEILLNRQQEGESWIKMGQKIDPLSALKRQLQETEQKLSDEQMISLTTTNKLKEVRQELTKTIQLERSLREKFVSQQQEMQGLQIHFQRQHEQHVGEINNMQMKYQQLQVKTSEEHRLALSHLQDENEKLKQALGQMESNAKAVTSSEIARLQHELDQWRLTCEQLKEQLSAIQQSDNERQQHIHQLQQCIQDLKNKAAQQEKATQQEMNDLLKQLSQTESNRSALQRDLTIYQNIQTENNSLHNKLRDVEKTNNSYCQRIQELEKQNHNLETKLKHCKNENEATLQASQCELDQLHQSNEMIKMKLEETVKDIVAKESLLAKQENDLAQYLDEVQQVTKELNIQREKNDELRRKNWKAMEALSKYEKLAEDKLNKMEKFIREINLVLSRFVPDFNRDINDDFCGWLKQFEEVVKVCGSSTSLKEELVRLKRSSEESEKTLKSQVLHYQETLLKTEIELRDRQRRAEEEELVWKEKLTYTENDLKQYEERLGELQGKLLIEENERKLSDLKAAEASKSLQTLRDSLEINRKEFLKCQELEKSLNKKISDLEMHLVAEKKTVKDLTSQTVKLNSLVRIGEDSLKAEQKVVKELQKLIDQKTSKTTTNGTATDAIAEASN